MKKMYYLKKVLISIVLLMITATTFAQWIQQGTDIDGEEEGDFSGQSVSLSADGMTLAIGAHYNHTSASGHVRVFQLIEGMWIQKGMDIDGEAPGDQSGRSVSLSADGLTVAIGAPYNNGNGTDSGHVRVFKFNTRVWSKVGSDIDGEAADDNLGFSVSLSDDGLTLVSGSDAPGNYARVCKLISGEWIQQGEDINGVGEVGWSADISSDGTTVAFAHTSNYTSSVIVYKLISGEWIQQGADIVGEESGDYSGWSVSLSSDGLILAIGAPFNDGNGHISGHTRVFKLISDVWIQQGTDIDGEAPGDQSGRSVSLSADGLTLAIGANGNQGNGWSCGHVRIYRFISNQWIQQGQDMDGEGIGDKSGWAVSLSSDGLTLAIGAYQNDGNGNNSGHVRVYSTTSLGIIENSFGEVLSIYPNSTSGVFSINLGESYQNISVIIADINGKIIQSNSFSNSQFLKFNIEEQPTGIYWLFIEIDKISKKQTYKKAMVRLIKK